MSALLPKRMLISDTHRLASFVVERGRVVGLNSAAKELIGEPMVVGAAIADVFDPSSRNKAESAVATSEAGVWELQLRQTTMSRVRRRSSSHRRRKGPCGSCSDGIGYSDEMQRRDRTERRGLERDARSVASCVRAASRETTPRRDRVDARLLHADDVPRPQVAARGDQARVRHDRADLPRANRRRRAATDPDRAPQRRPCARSRHEPARRGAARGRRARHRAKTHSTLGRRTRRRRRAAARSRRSTDSRARRAVRTVHRMSCPAIDRDCSRS